MNMENHILNINEKITLNQNMFVYNNIVHGKTKNNDLVSICKFDYMNKLLLFEYPYLEIIKIENDILYLSINNQNIIDNITMFDDIVNDYLFTMLINRNDCYNDIYALLQQNNVNYITVLKEKNKNHYMKIKINKDTQIFCNNILIEGTLKISDKIQLLTACNELIMFPEKNEYFINQHLLKVNLFIDTHYTKNNIDPNNYINHVFSIDKNIKKEIFNDDNICMTEIEDYNTNVCNNQEIHNIENDNKINDTLSDTNNIENDNESDDTLSDTNNNENDNKSDDTLTNTDNNENDNKSDNSSSNTINNENENDNKSDNSSSDTINNENENDNRIDNSSSDTNNNENDNKSDDTLSDSNNNKNNKSDDILTDNNKNDNKSDSNDVLITNEKQTKSEEIQIIKSPLKKEEIQIVKSQIKNELQCSLCNYIAVTSKGLKTHVTKKHKK